MPSVNGRTHYLPTISVTIIEVVHCVHWKPISSLKVSSYLNNCMELDISGLSGMVTTLCTVVTGVPSYGHHMKKVECANHAITCYQNHLEELCKDIEGTWYFCSQNEEDHPWCLLCNSSARSTGDITALRLNLCNGIWHYFGDHRQCRSLFCKHTTTDTIKCVL